MWKQPKKYLPVTYVDEDGVVYTRQQLTNKIYKSYGTEIIEQKESYGIYIHTIRRIGKVQEAPEQLNLF